MNHEERRGIASIAERQLETNPEWRGVSLHVACPLDDREQWWRVSALTPVDGGQLAIKLLWHEGTEMTPHRIVRAFILSQAVDPCKIDRRDVWIDQDPLLRVVDDVLWAGVVQLGSLRKIDNP